MNPRTLQLADGHVETSLVRNHRDANRSGEVMGMAAGAGAGAGVGAGRGSCAAMHQWSIPARHYRPAGTAPLALGLMTILLNEVLTVSRAARRCLLLLPGSAAITGHALWFNRVRCLTARVFSLLAIVMTLPTLCPARADALTARIRAGRLQIPVIGLAKAGISSVLTRECFVRRHLISVSALRMVNARVDEMTSRAIATGESNNRFRNAFSVPAQGGQTAALAKAPILGARADPGRIAAA